MKTIGVISIITILLFVYLLRRKKPVKIPVIYMGETQDFKQGIEVYNIDFSYVTTDKGEDLFLSDYQLYILRGKDIKSEFPNLTDGDCILVDNKIKRITDGYNLYVVNKYPPFSAFREVGIKKRQWIGDDTEIFGAIRSKISSEYIQKRRIK